MFAFSMQTEVVLKQLKVWTHESFKVSSGFVPGSQ
jgi:hypothetical protein